MSRRVQTSTTNESLPTLETRELWAQQIRELLTLLEELEEREPQNKLVLDAAKVSISKFRVAMPGLLGILACVEVGKYFGAFEWIFLKISDFVPRLREHRDSGWSDYKQIFPVVSAVIMLTFVVDATIQLYSARCVFDDLQSIEPLIEDWDHAYGREIMQRQFNAASEAIHNFRHYFETEILEEAVCSPVEEFRKRNHFERLRHEMQREVEELTRLMSHALTGLQEIQQQIDEANFDKRIKSATIQGNGMLGSGFVLIVVGAFVQDPGLVAGGISVATLGAGATRFSYLACQKFEKVNRDVQERMEQTRDYLLKVQKLEDCLRGELERIARGCAPDSRDKAALQKKTLEYAARIAELEAQLARQAGSS